MYLPTLYILTSMLLPRESNKSIEIIEIKTRKVHKNKRRKLNVWTKNQENN